MTATITKKAGKGRIDGVVSELATYFHVKPGHVEELQAACRRFVEELRRQDPKETIKTGLRDTRHVVFDEGRMLLWATTFETEWDPYVDDAILSVGFEHFVDWLQHTTEWDELFAWVEESGGLQALSKNSDNPDFEKNVRNSTAGLKKILQDNQEQAAAYFNPLSTFTMPQVVKAQKLDAAFQEVLDDPAAEEALSHPALKPLLAHAAA
ncbi:MAG: hypothetical protein JF597_18020 [Streptomyces sp.]|uniref:hypothetical protein n=1 Tax=Streptomyces sp. TaxID=1931 RepID=UPI0025D9EFC7|nr:hypothetical protein [Streptomyces sp.]MBW8795420.1 hypothetical protein [Streptomyces sp.]